METILLYIDKIGMIGIIITITAFLIGMKFPDWDFKLKLQHRSIITHSPLFLFLLLELYKKQPSDVFRFFVAGFALAFGVHFIFDFFPKGWARGALLHIPIGKIALSKKLSVIFFFIFIVISLYINIKLSKNFYEYIFFLILAFWCFLKEIKKEEKFLKPFFLFLGLFLIIGNFKYKEIRNIKKLEKNYHKYYHKIEKEIKNFI